MSIFSKTATVSLVILASFASTLTAQAGGRRGYNGLEDGYVVAHSRYGNGSASGPVRQGATGLQVRLPGGTWVYCRASCSETLRVESVDLTETREGLAGYGTANGECGIFGCLDIGR